MPRINTAEGEELIYVQLARKLWIYWAGLNIGAVTERSKLRAERSGIKTKDIETAPAALRFVEQICHAQDEARVPCPEEWNATRGSTLRGFLGRQPGQRRDMGVDIPSYLFVPSWLATPKHGPWHWLLTGEALAGAIGADGLYDHERTAALERLRKSVEEAIPEDHVYRDDDSVTEIIQHLAELAAGPPMLGVRALIVLSRLARADDGWATIRSLIDQHPPMFRLLRAFTMLVADTVVPVDTEPAGSPDTSDSATEDLPAVDGEPSAGPATEASDEEQVEDETGEDDDDPKAKAEKRQEARQEEAKDRKLLARKVIDVTPHDDPYPARSLRLEMLARICDPRLERLQGQAQKSLLKVVKKKDATWRERAYAAEVLTRQDPATAATVLGVCLESWEPQHERAGTHPTPLSHAAAVLVERDLMGQGLKRAVGAQLTPGKAKGSATLDDVVERAIERYGANRWVIAALEQDAQMREPVEGPIRDETTKLATNRFKTADKRPLARGRRNNSRKTNKEAETDEPPKMSYDESVWMTPDTGIASRVRFLCEEAVLSIAGTTRRRSVDCLAVAGLGGFASDVLLKAIVEPEDGSIPIFVQELGAWAVGFLRSPNPDRLKGLAKAARRHLDAAQALTPKSADQVAAVAAAHAALWAIGDAGGLEPVGRDAASDDDSEVATVLRDALNLGTEDHLAPMRWAAAYTLRYCLPGTDLPLARPDADPKVRGYQKMELTWLAPQTPGHGNGTHPSTSGPELALPG